MAPAVAPVAITAQAAPSPEAKIDYAARRARLPKLTF
jgi:hypothetical protein